jgi:hypothetical protein
MKARSAIGAFGSLVNFADLLAQLLILLCAVGGLLLTPGVIATSHVIIPLSNQIKSNSCLDIQDSCCTLC